ncbi:PilZ domain-containing protein [Novosphingobium album (ex Hu et al. 2023)]|uniref:PilZ domain-containing protein n=1 Tax=Novosphingobium album (ex Hu et al. 2023) TaxID=2930093 RepID=A0ABT0AXN1_9SPHN|nr:PilZ domain-containing protein [Novosphingobium album (ex Hu et al. 2023)]MCJ2177581.1 PilZ domain-containing protein [Novosphingobium album (ex Hu et al. 2023)]
MKVPEFSQSRPIEEAEGLNEKRIEPRVALLLRSAKLAGASGEFLCIVRDVSNSGAKLRLFHPMVDSEELVLETATGQRVAVEKVWENGNEAGIRFLDAIDISQFVAEHGPFPKRPMRINLDCSARLRHGGAAYGSRIHDLSSQGAKIETSQHLAIGQVLGLEADNLPAFDVTVRWRRHPYYGLVFHQVMSLEEFALRVHQLQAQGRA